MLLYLLQAHIHHYLQVEGFEKDDFVESREKVINVFNHYVKIEKQSPTSISRLSLH